MIAEPELQTKRLKRVKLSRSTRTAANCREQRALFMWNLWNEMPSKDGNYILQLRSAVPFAAAAFYTRNWIVVGNLPVWSYKEGQAR